MGKLIKDLGVPQPVAGGVHGKGQEGVTAGADGWQTEEWGRARPLLKGSRLHPPLLDRQSAKVATAVWTAVPAR